MYLWAIGIAISVSSRPEWNVQKCYSFYKLMHIWYIRLLWINSDVCTGCHIIAVFATLWFKPLWPSDAEFGLRAPSHYLNNVALSSLSSFGIHLRAVSILMISVFETSLKLLIQDCSCIYQWLMSFSSFYVALDEYPYLVLRPDVTWDNNVNINTRCLDNAS